jgi:hypothetical protein
MHYYPKPIIARSSKLVFILIDLKGLPLIHSYDNIQELNRNLDKQNRQHDLVISVSSLNTYGIDYADNNFL